MNKLEFETGNVGFARRFLLQNLPAPLTRASEHQQFFDNYLTETRLFLRRIRFPQTRTEQYFFCRQNPLSETDCLRQFYNEIELSAYEYEVLAIFEGNELRYNRYFFEYQGNELTLDLHLGDLWGLIIATANFANENEAKNFVLPEFVFTEITNSPLLTGAKLTAMKFADVRSAINL